MFCSWLQSHTNLKTEDIRLSGNTSQDCWALAVYADVNLGLQRSSNTDNWAMKHLVIDNESCFTQRREINKEATADKTVVYVIM